MYELTDSDVIERRIKEEGNYKEFIYHDVVCEIKRIAGMGHLCGYLHLGIVSEETREIVNEHFHCGITYENNGVYGFDCTHVGDISPNYIHDDNYPFWPGETYKTMAYVEQCLKSAVDALSEYKTVGQVRNYDIGVLDDLEE